MGKRISLKVTTFLEYFVVLFIILECNTVYKATVGRDYYLPEITAIATAMLVILEIGEFRINQRIVNRLGLALFPYYCFMLIFMLFSVSGEDTLVFITKFLIVLPLLTLIFAVHKQQNQQFRILYKFSNIMLLLSASSLVFWLLGSMLGVISPSGHILVKWGTRYSYPSYWGIYVERQRVFGGILRNQSFFCEAPMFSLCLVFALSIELFLRPFDNSAYPQKGFERKHFYYGRVILLILTILSTMTTTGTILLVAILVMRFVLIRPKRRGNYLLKAFASIIVVTAGAIVAINIFEAKSVSGSWQIRVDDFMAGFRAWLGAPIFGTGFGDYTATRLYMDKSIRTNLGFSNSIFQILAQGGILLASVYILAMLGSLLSSIKDQDYWLSAFCLIVLIEFVFTVFGYTFLMLLLLSFLYGQLFARKIAVHSVNQSHGKARHREWLSTSV